MMTPERKDLIIIVLLALSFTLFTSMAIWITLTTSLVITDSEIIFSKFHANTFHTKIYMAGAVISLILLFHKTGIYVKAD